MRETEPDAGVAFDHPAEDEMSDCHRGLVRIADKLREIEALETPIGTLAWVKEDIGICGIKSLPQGRIGRLGKNQLASTRRRGKATMSPADPALGHLVCHVGSLQWQV